MRIRGPGPAPPGGGRRGRGGHPGGGQEEDWDWVRRGPVPLARREIVRFRAVVPAQDRVARLVLDPPADGDADEVVERVAPEVPLAVDEPGEPAVGAQDIAVPQVEMDQRRLADLGEGAGVTPDEIGRASCRERV